MSFASQLSPSLSLSRARRDEARPPSSSTRRRRAAAALAGLASAAVLAVSSSSSSITGSNLRLAAGGERKLSIALPGGGCLVTPAEVPRPPVTPVFAASYPGSGAKMTWNLIEALTGLVTGDEYGFSRDGSNVVSLKTHYPHGDGIAPKDDIAVTGQPMKRGFILMRNPRYAIPSLHSFVYEVTNDLPAHSTRAPMDEWRRWRDANVPNQIQAWAKSIEYWMDRLTADNRILITYESMVDDATGPATAQRLVDFLARDPNVNPVDNESVECVWKAVVKYHETPHLPSLAHRAGEPNQNAEEGRMLRKMPAEEILAGVEEVQPLLVASQQLAPELVASQQLAPELVAAARKLAGPPAQSQAVLTPPEAQAQPAPAEPQAVLTPPETQAQPALAQPQAMVQAPLEAQAQPAPAQPQAVVQAPFETQAQPVSAQPQAVVQAPFETQAQPVSAQPQAVVQAPLEAQAQPGPAQPQAVQAPLEAQDQTAPAQPQAVQAPLEAQAQPAPTQTQAMQQSPAAAGPSTSVYPEAKAQPLVQAQPAKIEPFSMYTQYAEEKSQAQQPEAVAAPQSNTYPELKVHAQAAPVEVTAVAAPQSGVPARRLQEAAAAVDGAIMDAAQEAYAASRKLEATRGGHHAVSSMAADRGLIGGAAEAPISEANKQRANAALQGMVAAPLQIHPPVAQAGGAQSPPPAPDLAQAQQVQPLSQEVPLAPAQPPQPSAPQAPNLEAQTERVLARNLVEVAQPPQEATQGQPQQQQEEPGEERQLMEGFSAQKAIEYARRDQRRAKEATILARKEEAATGEKSTLETQQADVNDPNAKHKADNHPALPSSFRSGPATKPYTKGQIQLMVEVMEALQAKYKNDEQLVRVLDAYIKDVKSMPGE